MLLNRQRYSGANWRALSDYCCHMKKLETIGKLMSKKVQVFCKVLNVILFFGLTSTFPYVNK
jgi:hypothetical protein